MSWYGLDEIDEAIKETKELLLPFDFWKWTKLAVIVFFIGGGVNLPTNFAPGPTGDTGLDTGDTGFDTNTVPETDMQLQGFENLNQSTDMPFAGNGILFALILFGLAVGLLFGYLNSVFEFIFYRSLIDKEVGITQNFRNNIWKGARYFGFELFYGLAIIGLIASLIGVFALSEILGVFALLVFIPLIVLVGIFGILTHDFVLLRMLESDEKLLESWKSLWPELNTQWKQVAVYLIVKLLLGLVVGVASGIIIVLLTLVLAVPVIVALLAGAEGILAGLVIGPAVLLWLALVLYISVPFRTYLYYYTILVYHDLTAS